MKKIFIAFMSLVALVACNSDYTVETLDSTPILFGDSFVQNKTRAANEADQSTVITTANIAAFDVWGFMDDASGVVFNAERVTKTDGKWTYANLQYWLPKHTYYFGAVAPVDSQNITVTTAEDVTGGLGTIAFVNTGVEDLIYAEQKVTTPDVISGNLDPVSLQFAHLLAKAKFTFINGFKNENATIKVTNIKITNAPQAGTIDLTVDPTAWAWQLDSTKTFELGFGDANGGAAIPALDAEATVDNAAESDYVRYILPSNGDYVYYNLSFDVELYMGDKLGLKATRTATITKQNILIGKAYNFVATIDATNIAEDALQPIEFDDITVEDWDEFGDVEYTPTTPEEGEGDEPTTPENPETPAEPVVLYLQPNANWNTDGARYAAYFFDGNGGETWVDLALVDGETNVYSLTAPEGYANVIFCRMNPSTTENNWDNKWNQTADLTVPTDENTLYTVPADAWDNSDNTNWSVYTPTTTPEEPEVPAVTYTTVAEFLAAAEDDTTLYTLKGTITAVANTTYGNFDLTDETGTVYIYGLCSPEGASKYWAESGAKLGDDIVIKTIRTSFNSAPQGKNATFVELLPGTLAFFTVDPSVVDLPSAGGDKVVTVSAYNTDAAVTATSDSEVFTATVNGYEVTISAAANELEQDVTGTITIKVGELEAQTVKVNLAAKPAAGVVEGGKDDFGTLTNSSSYGAQKTTAGWVGANCAVMAGGSSDSNPVFKTMMGTDTTVKGMTINGKTAAVGTITSPVLTTGCGVLKFNYGYPFSESNGIDFKVEIIQNGATVQTFQVKDASATKLQAYTFEKTVNVAGEFQIKFTNNTPSNNSSSNKDRYTIWNIEWTGYNN